MSNYEFTKLFCEEKEFAESVIKGIRYRQGILQKREEFTPYTFGVIMLRKISEQINEDDPETMKKVLKGFIRGYNQSHIESYKTFPKTSDIYWQAYRRNRMAPTLGNRPKSDEEMADSFLIDYQTILENWSGLEDIFGKEPPISLDTEPQIKLLREPESGAFGVKVYHFKIGNRDPIQSIWDLRDSNFPKKFPSLENFCMNGR